MRETVGGPGSTIALLNIEGCSWEKGVEIGTASGVTYFPETITDILPAVRSNGRPIQLLL